MCAAVMPDEIGRVLLLCIDWVVEIPNVFEIHGLDDFLLVVRLRVEAGGSQHVNFLWWRCRQVKSRWRHQGSANSFVATR